MITDETRKKWDEKIATIQEAREMGIILLYPEEPVFIKGLILTRKLEKDFSHKQVKWLNRIFERKKHGQNA